MPWLLATAAVGAIGSKLAADKAAKAQKNAANQADARIREGTDYVQNGELNTVYGAGGDAAFNQINNLLGLGEDPGAAQQGLDNYMASSGYQTQLKAGQQAVDASASARGIRNSGATLKALTRFGTGLGSQYFNNYLGQLGNQANKGLAARQGIANATTGAAGQAAGAIQQGYSGAAQTQLEGNNNAIGAGLWGVTQAFPSKFGGQTQDNAPTATPNTNPSSPYTAPWMSNMG